MLKYLKNKILENWEFRCKFRNEVIKQRRIVIKEYWRKKFEDLKNNLKVFFKIFKFFLSLKGCIKGEDIYLNVNGNVIKD